MLLRAGRGGVGIRDRGQLAEVDVAESLVGVVVNSAEDGLDIFSARVETVSLQEVGKIANRDLGQTAGNLVEGSHLDEIGRQSQLVLRVVSVSLQGQLLLEKAHHQADDSVGEGVGRTEVGRQVSVLGNVSEAVVGGGKNHLAELVELQSGICGRVVLSHDVLTVSELTAHVVLAQEVDDVVGIDGTDSAGVNHVEGLEGFELGVEREVLSADFDLYLLSGKPVKLT